MSKDKKDKPDQRYKGNGKHTWEYVTFNTERLRVLGGYLYRYHIPGQSLDNGGATMNWRSGSYDSPRVAITTDGLLAMQFVPMPDVVKHKV